jgi:hypothetical protein
MGEKFSDGAIVQHLSKLRQKMAENGHDVPPPLKRGTTVVPSKIYATSSGTSRRKSLPNTPTSAATVVTTPKPKQSASKKRTRRAGMDSDSDSQPDDMDIADTSDEEYGASGRKKKKKQQRSVKSKQATNNLKTTGETRDVVDEAQPIAAGTAVKSQVVSEETINESIETPGPASRTRGVRTDYSRLEQISDEEDANADNGKNNDDDPIDESEEEDDEEEMVQDETEDLKAKSDGEVSPRSKVPASPATPTHLMVSAPIRPF